MNSEMKSGKWFLSGLVLQLGMGYTLSYIVYTVGTLIASPASLDASSTICGGVGVVLMVAAVTVLCIRGGRKGVLAK
jgi:ferrous iron transport protein B